MTTITSPAPSAPERRSAQPVPATHPPDGGTDFGQGRGGAFLHRWRTHKNRNASRRAGSRADPRRHRPDVDAADQDRVADTFRTALMLHVMR